MRHAMRCPSEGDALSRFMIAKGKWAWGCPTCQGHAMTVAIIRQQLHQDYRRKLVERMHASDSLSPYECPACQQRMHLVGFELDDETVELDICRTCSLVWFDQGEFEAAPSAPPRAKPKPTDGKTPEQREALANVEIQLAMATAERRRQEAGPTKLSALPAMFGMPVELNDKQSASKPWGTWGLAALITAISLAALQDQELLWSLALVPAQVTEQPMTLFTAFFVHGDLFHLLGNMWFLVVFGDNIEQHYGRVRWLVLLVTATLLGSLSHIAVNPGDTTPCVGASGGISGLILCYALTLPNARLGLFLWHSYSIRAQWITFSAKTGLILWLLLQLYYAALQIGGLCSISAVAHLGGAGAGAACWWLWRDPAPES